MKSPSPSLLVIGAGPAGLMGAIHAARVLRGHGRVILCEKLETIGKRLLATGGGRCNLTNIDTKEGWIKAFGGAGRFISPAFHRLDGEGLRRFFAERGLPTKITDGFHVFPACESAKAVRDTLLREAQRSDVDIRRSAPVDGLRVVDGRVVSVRSVDVETRVDAVLLATGGAAWPGLGGGGSGYDLAKQAGHSLRGPFPALVPLLIREAWVKACAGITLEVEAQFDIPREKGRWQRGVILFTHRGLSGPLILNLSGRLAEALVTETPQVLKIRWRPGEGQGAWRERLQSLRQEGGKRSVWNSIRPLLPTRIAEAILAEAGISSERRLSEMTRPEEQRLRQLLAETTLTVTGTEGLAHAMAARGGVPLKELEGKTLRSRRVANLYFAGEVLDVDGPCGGYNLQWAFASGTLAGECAAKQLLAEDRAQQSQSRTARR